MSTPFQYDMFTGVTTEFLPHDDEKFVLRHSGDASPVLDANAEDRSFNPSGYGDHGTRDLKHVARIPPIVYQLWIDKHGVDALNPEHKDDVRKLLNDPDWAYLRTGGGVL